MIAAKVGDIIASECKSRPILQRPCWTTSRRIVEGLPLTIVHHRESGQQALHIPDMETQQEGTNTKPRFIFMYGPRPRYGKEARAHVLKDHMRQRREKAQYPVRVRRRPSIANADVDRNGRSDAKASQPDLASLDRQGPDVDIRCSHRPNQDTNSKHNPSCSDGLRTQEVVVPAAEDTVETCSSSPSSRTSAIANGSTPPPRRVSLGLNARQGYLVDYFVNKALNQVHNFKDHGAPFHPVRDISLPILTSDRLGLLSYCMFSHRLISKLNGKEFGSESVQLQQAMLRLLANDLVGVKLQPMSCPCSRLSA